MKIKTIQDLSNVESWEDLKKYASQTIRALVDVINGGVDLVDNCSTSYLTVSFTTANADLKVNHTLGRVPNGFAVVGTSVAMSVYEGSLPSTESVIYLRSTVVGNAKVLVL